MRGVCEKMVSAKRAILRAEPSIVARAEAFKLWNSGKRIVTVARMMGKSETFVRNAINRKLKHNRFSDLPRPGRPKKVTREVTKQIVKIARHQRNGSMRDISRKVSSRITPVSTMSVQRALKRVKVKPYYSQPKPMLTTEHKTARLQWATAHLNEPIEVSMRRVFADEKHFVVGGGRFHVFRYQWEE